MNAFASECDREPIHAPGAVQPFGMMLVVDEAERVCAVSANSAQLLGQDPAVLLDRPLGPLVLPPDVSISWHQHAGMRVGEIEPTPQFAALTPKLSNEFLRAEVGRALASMDAASTVVALCNSVVHHVQAMTHFDRVMLYRFDTEWNGEVVAESVRPGVNPYLGQRFPASDIPAQARAMLCLNRVRIIPDAVYTPVPLITANARQSVDMGLALVRSVSPVHLEYLANMEVRASLTLSILCGGKLWGLIACHHCTPLYVSRVARDSCEIVARLMTALIPAKARVEDELTERRLRGINDKLHTYLGRNHDFVVGLVHHSPNLLDLLPQEGAAAAICIDDQWTLLGNVPSIPEMRSLLAWLAERGSQEEVFCTDQLPALYPPAANFSSAPCGLMAMSLPKNEADCVLWFLPELVQTIPWAGQPEKQPAADGCSLHPRKSFRLWQQTVRGRSRPIVAAEREAALHLRKSMVEADLARQFAREREARAQMTRERHRFAFLAEAGAVLSESLDTQTTLRQFATLAAGAICDWCVIYLHQEGQLQRHVVRHNTPQGQLVADQLMNFPALHEVGDSPLRSLFEDRQTVLVGRATADWCNRVAPTPAYASFLHNQLGIRSLIAVPLVARDRLLGVLKLVRSEASSQFTPDDVPWIKEVARRAAHAVDNALLYQEAQQAIQAREHVLGVVSHDLKNPLGAIQLNAQRLGRLLGGPPDASLSERTRVSVERIEKSCRRMHGLIEDVLNVARLEAGKLIVLEKTRTLADSLLRDVYDMLEPLAAERQVRLSVHNHVAGCEVLGEPERLMQVFSNLVGNAIKFTPAGGDVVVELQGHTTAPTFSVRDTGPGIALADQAHIFDRFWQATRTARQGAGLGLAIAKGIVEAHGGDIWVQSSEGRGTTFYFTVPSTP